MTVKEIKAISKQLIHGNTYKGLMIKLISFLILCVSAVVSFFIKIYVDNKVLVICSLLIIILLIYTFLSSFKLGEKAWYNSRINNPEKGTKRFVYWLLPKNTLKALKFRISLITIKIFWSVITLLPSASFFSSIIILAYSGGIENYLFITLLFGAIIMLITGMIFRFIILQRYFIAEYLISSNPKLKTLQAIRQSKNLTEGHIFDIIKFKLSFLPSAFSCLLIIPVLFIIPYYKQSCSVIAKSITI